MTELEILKLSIAIIASACIAGITLGIMLAIFGRK